MLSSFAASQDYETIPWNSKRKLTWNDFQGKNRFSTSGTRDNMKVDFKIDTFFYPAKSWYDPSLCDEGILKHEQLHFDISEIYARKMKKRLANESFTYSNVKSRVKTIYKEIMQELDEYQNQYDDETNFSRDREQQILWNSKIEELLSEK